MSEAPLLQRPVPYTSDRTRAFWTSGADGRLRVPRCQNCGTYQHPPKPICPKCHGREIAYEPVSGKGTVHAFTINRYLWKAGMPPPYVVAEVEIAEQPGLCLLTNIVDCPIEDVHVGMPVTVAFIPSEDLWIPVFHP
jgi:uncharacterized OB-fold protein